MEKLQLQLFGAPVVSYAGRRATFRSRRALALLIFLAVEDRFHTRDQLAALLWPDTERTHSRMLLRSAVALLRNGLHSIGLDSEHVLVREQDRLRLDRGIIELDLDTLKDADLPTERSVGMNMPKGEKKIAQLHEALRAYRGDFLGGFTLDDAPNFDEWVTVQRERYHWHMHQIFDQLTLVYHQQHDWSGALQIALRWVEHDPLYEPAYARLITCHVEIGDTTAANRAFERCRVVLERELGIEPSSETAALLAQPAPAKSTVSLPHAPRLPTRQSAANSDFQQLQAAVKHMQEGATKVVVMKQAYASKVLFVEFANWVKPQNVDLIYGRAYDLAGRVPYQIISDALRERIEQERAPDDLLPDVWLSELSRLVPDLRDRYPDLAMSPTDNATLSIHLYEAVFRFTSALAQRRPLIWFLDDMQHADGASLDLLHYLVRRWDADDVPALLIATTDTTAYNGADYPAPVVARWIAHLGRDLPIKLLASPVVQLAVSQQAYHVLAA